MNPTPIIPDYGACADRQEAGQRLTALERFVYDHEPRDVFEAEAWREQLSHVLAEIETVARLVTALRDLRPTSTLGSG
jgi:hypothetical protein